MATRAFLPGVERERGTALDVAEAGRLLAIPTRQSPSTTGYAGGPPPRFGEEW